MKGPFTYKKKSLKERIRNCVTNICFFHFQVKLIHTRAKRILKHLKRSLPFPFIVWVFITCATFFIVYSETKKSSPSGQKTDARNNFPLINLNSFSNFHEKKKIYRSDFVGGMPGKRFRFLHKGVISSAKQQTKTVENFSYESEFQNKPTNEESYFFSKNFTINDPFLKSWSEKKTVSCDGKFEGFANMFVRWINITVDPSKSRGAIGGENVTQVLKQRESSELLNPKKGFFVAECRSTPKYVFLKYFKSTGHLPIWLRTVSISRVPNRHLVVEKISNFSIIIQRNEYANVYHSTNDIFNVFLLHIFFHKNPKNSVIIFADGHPRGNMDPLWEKLFGRIIRIRHLKKATKFENLVWPMMEKFSPLNLFDLKHVSYIDHFRTFVFQTYGIMPRSDPDCKNINVLFLWRHDYLAHPRNPKGKLMRKIKNENELYNSTKLAFPGVTFRAVDLAPMTIEEQLTVISKSDVMIAMHGAGLMLELFLPPKGGVIELLPSKLKNFSKRQFDLFKVITDRIPLHYLRWQNKDKKNEVAEGYTYIPPGVVKSLLNQTLSKVCPYG